MNVWKPIAIVATAGLALSVGVQIASAQSTIGQSNIGNCHNQPNMLAAARNLYAARDALARAEHDKGGWRGRAQTHAQNAIHETETGCAYADTH